MASITIADREWDLIGPAIDDDLRRLLRRYGMDELLQAIKRQTKQMPGRKCDNDQVALKAALEEDASIWLGGGDPRQHRSDYSIAKEYASKLNRYSLESSAHRRLMKKLKARRHEWMLELAVGLSRSGHSHEVHIGVLEAVIQVSRNAWWSKVLENVTAIISEYEAKFGVAPPADLDFLEVTAAANRPLRGIGLLGFSSAATADDLA